MYVIAIKNIGEVISQIKKLNIILISNITETLQQRYETVLSYFCDKICEYYRNHIYVYLNLLTDRLFYTKMNNCNSGDRSFALSVNGEIFPCLGYYFSNFRPAVSLDEDFRYDYLFKLEKAPVCKLCDCWHCYRCIWNNYKTTNERNIPSHEECVKSHLERKYSKKILDKLNEYGLKFHVSQIEELDYYDPLEKYFKQPVGGINLVRT